MLTPVTIAEHAARAGWRDRNLPIAIAVAMAESGGNPNAHNTRGGADARGVWQVNVAHDAHPEYASVNLYDPQANANAAFKIWQAGGWGPWQAHGNNSYLLFMPAALVAIEAAGVKAIITNPAGVAAGAAGMAADAAKQLPGADMLSAAKDAVTLGYKGAGWVGNRNNWIRVAYVLLGVGMIWGGLVMVAGKPVMSTTEAVAGGIVGVKGKALAK